MKDLIKTLDKIGANIHYLRNMEMDFEYQGVEYEVTSDLDKVFVHRDSQLFVLTNPSDIVKILEIE